MGEHTPGPWRASSCGTFEVYSDNKLVACCDTEDVQGKRRRAANANMVAAAPDMFAALEVFTERGHHDTCIAVLTTGYECDCGYDQAVAAIRSARHGTSP